MDETAKPDATVIRISPMAHIAPIFAALGLVGMFVPWLGNWSLGLLAVPLAMSVAIERLRTVADRDSVTARTMLSSRTVPWEDLVGLRFSRGGWARARRSDGWEMTLPAVTFSTLPTLTAASGGKVPNPYQR